MNKLNQRRILKALELLREATPEVEVFIKASIAEQVDLLSQYTTAPELAEQGGSHMAAVRNWMQWNCLNGSDVTWGSDDVLRVKEPLTPRLLEELACQVAAAAINDFKGLN